MSMVEQRTATQVYRVWIKAPPERIWEAITSPEWTDRYGYGGFLECDELAPGARYVMNAGAGMQEHGVTGAVIDGEIVEVDPPRRLVQTWRMLMDPEMAAEPAQRVTWELTPTQYGTTRLTVTHELEGAPITAALVSGEHEAQGAGGGWGWILSDLKTLLESGEAFTRAAPGE